MRFSFQFAGFLAYIIAVSWFQVYATAKMGIKLKSREIEFYTYLDFTDHGFKFLPHLLRKL